jgi:hypothetical protein
MNIVLNTVTFIVSTWQMMMNVDGHILITIRFEHFVLCLAKNYEAKQTIQNSLITVS